MPAPKSSTKSRRRRNPPQPAAIPFPAQATQRGKGLWRMAERQILEELRPKSFVAGYDRLGYTSEGKPTVMVTLAPPLPVPSLSPADIELNIGRRAAELGFLAQESGVRLLSEHATTGGLASGLTRGERQRLRQLEIEDILRTAKPRYRSHLRSDATSAYIRQELIDREANHTVRFPGWRAVSVDTIKHDLVDILRLQKATVPITARKR
jgi:hypothetical protein